VLNRVLLINPPVWEDTGRHFSESPPLGLLWIASKLIQDGYHVDFLDAENRKMTRYDVSQYVKRKRRHDMIIGLTCTMLGYRSTAKLIQKHLWRYKTILGGPVAEIFGGNILKDIRDLNHLCIGDGFNAIQQIPNCDKIIFGGKETDFNELPMPAWGLVDFKNYKGNSPVLKWPSIDTFTNMGCPFQCVFCARPSIYKTPRFRSPENVVAELRYFTMRGVKEVFFYNDEFNVDLEHAIQICNAIIDAKKIGKINKKMIFKTQLRTSENLLPERLLGCMAEAGFKVAMWGIESGSQNVLDKIRKGTTVQGNERALQLAHKFGIKNWAFLMTQNLGEKWQDVEKSRKFIKRNRKNIDWLQVTVSTPYYGTPLYAMAEKNGWIIDENTDRFSTHESVMNTPWMTAEEAIKARNYLQSSLGIGRIIRETLTTKKGIKQLPRRSMKLAKRLIQ
jgi:radical SAM superfamily enzyme YgiQ (UPF0313 family)